MATRSKKTKAAKRTSAQSRVTVDRGEREERSSNNLLDKIQTDLEKNQSYLNLILGALIVIVLGVLIFNYFNKPATNEGTVTPIAEQTTDENGDVTKENLPGKYTVKEGDTLFLIAEKYFDDGNKYTEIITENNLSNDSIEIGQELTIPKLESQESPSPSTDPSASPSASASPEAEESVAPSPSLAPSPSMTSQASTAPAPVGSKGDTMDTSAWGQPISGETYTVQAGDWLSKIAGRAYGDIMKYDAIAKANNITNPNTIEVGTVLKIPRD